MNKKDVDLIEKVYAQMEALYNEMGILSKKAQNDAVNKFKLKFINNIIINANQILQEKYRPFTDFEKFDEDELPTNSDVVMILAQYLYSMEKIRIDNIYEHSGYWYWLVDGKKSSFETFAPKKQ